MTKYDPPRSLPDDCTKTSAGDVPKTRHCLRCGAEFQSTGFGDRICRRCKGSNVWRNGVATTYGKSGGR